MIDQFSNSHHLLLKNKNKENSNLKLIYLKKKSLKKKLNKLNKNKINNRNKKMNKSNKSNSNYKNIIKIKYKSRKLYSIKSNIKKMLS
jgi:hypothetical protein